MSLAKFQWSLESLLPPPPLLSPISLILCISHLCIFFFFFKPCCRASYTSIEVSMSDLVESIAIVGRNDSDYEEIVDIVVYQGTFMCVCDGLIRRSHLSVRLAFFFQSIRIAIVIILITNNFFLLTRCPK